MSPHSTWMQQVLSSSTAWNWYEQALDFLVQQGEEVAYVGDMTQLFSSNRQHMQHPFHNT